VEKGFPGVIFVYILVIDEGTTGTTAMLFNELAQPVARGYREFSQIYPKPGWVEHDPREIWERTLESVADLWKQGFSPADVCAMGITNQRETVVAWDRKTGEAVHNAIVWQCRRTSDYCRRLEEQSGVPEMIRSKTGLRIDPYFSATKIAWIMENSSEARRCLRDGSLAVGTIDSWLIWKLTGGRSHFTDFTNASRTLLFNICTGKWDPELLDCFGVPEELLPGVLDCDGCFGTTDAGVFWGVTVPVAGVAGDQQAAAFGQTCFQTGSAKHTYGTGGFMLTPVGRDRLISGSGLLTTIAHKLRGEEIEYALEGSNFVAGAAVQWLRDELRLIDAAPDSEYFAGKVADTGGVYLVPAFVGLGAPYWDMDARGALVGLTRGTGKAHVVRAALESMAYQVRDLFEAVQSDTGIEIKRLRVDGGAAANDLLLQIQSNILQIAVDRPEVIETTALGAAYLAGINLGLWDTDRLKELWQLDRTFYPEISKQAARELYAGWRQAVDRVRSTTPPST